MTQNELKRILSTAAVIAQNFYMSCQDAILEIMGHEDYYYTDIPIELRAGKIAMAYMPSYFRSLADIVDDKRTETELMQLTSFVKKELERVCNIAREINDVVGYRLEDGTKMDIEVVGLYELLETVEKDDK